MFFQIFQFTDLNYMFTLTRQWLWVFGIWPDPHMSLNDFRWPNIRFIIIVCNISLYVSAPQMMNVIRAWGNMTRMVENFVSANLSLMAVCKLIVTWYHGKTLQPLIASIMTDWMTSTTNWERNIMLKIAGHGRNLSFRCCMSTLGLLTFSMSFHMLRFFKNIHQPQRNLIYRLEIIQESPNYEITYVIQIFGGIYTILANYMIDSFVSVLVLHVCSQLINLRLTINNLVNELANNSISSSRKERFKKDLAAIVVRHEHLIRNAKTIDGCYSSVLFMNLFLTTLQMCFIAFQIFTVHLNYMFTTTRQFLWLFGVWPDPHMPLSDFRWPSIRLIIVICNIFLYVFIPQMINVIRAWGNMTRMVEYFVSTNSSLMAMCKLIVTWYHGKKLQQLIMSIMTDWMTTTNWERNIMLKSTRHGRNISFRCCATVTGLIIMSFCLHIIRMIKIVHLPYRTLIYRMDNIQKSPTYEITYCIQFLGGMYSLLAIYTIDSFVSILVLHTCSQLTNLRMTLNNLVNEITNDSISSSRKESFRKGLAAIVVRHEHLIRYARKFPVH
ncbi:hypothetical protein ALC57_12636 [Trachymyrmex cornetzi]|uniref:Odorant receptor 13a n=1 Tax=Trachymyrmex cornetzi TaxID=471704 RepID=A0A195DRG3_9HYME|nr:hypothetical protein ALC57_12636 [Trachymyrmex cornetzi]